MNEYSVNTTESRTQLFSIFGLITVVVDAYLFLPVDARHNPTTQYSKICMVV